MSRVRVRVRVSASDYPRGRVAQRFNAGWIEGGRKSGVWQKNLIFFVEIPNLNVFVTLIHLNHAKYGL